MLLNQRRATVLVSAVALGVLAFWTFPVVMLDSVDRAEVRAATVSLMEAETAVGRMPDDLDDRQNLVSSGRKARRLALEQIWVPEQVDTQAKDWQAGFELVAGDPDYDAYTDNRLMVTEWENVRWTYSGVLLTFTGHEELHGPRDSGWSPSASTRYQVKLQQVGSDDEWRLASVYELEAP